MPTQPNGYPVYPPLTPQELEDIQRTVRIQQSFGKLGGDLLSPIFSVRDLQDRYRTGNQMLKKVWLLAFDPKERAAQAAYNKADKEVNLKYNTGIPKKPIPEYLNAF